MNAPYAFDDSIGWVVVEQRLDHASPRHVIPPEIRMSTLAGLASGRTTSRARTSSRWFTTGAEVDARPGCEMSGCGSTEDPMPSRERLAGLSSSAGRTYQIALGSQRGSRVRGRRTVRQLRALSPVEPTSSSTDGSRLGQRGTIQLTGPQHSACAGRLDCADRSAVATTGSSTCDWRATRLRRPRSASSTRRRWSRCMWVASCCDRRST